MGDNNSKNGRNEEAAERGVRRLDELEKQNKELHDENMRRIAELEQQKKELCDKNKMIDVLRRKRQKLLRRDMGVKVTLDEDTMNPYLRVSKDGRELWWTDQRQNLTDIPERFDEYPCVLANRLPAEMRWGCYWEVEVGNKKSWELGVARDTVCRKGQLSLSPGAGFWVLSLWDGKLTALTDPETPLDTKIPTRLGICIDYEEKKVSFYNAVDGSDIYTFEEKLDRSVRPFFSPGNNDNIPLCII